jgi:two-component system, NtrC family, sensor kinase
MRLATLFIFLGFMSSAAAQSIEWNSNMKQSALAPFLQWFEDSKHAYGIEQVSSDTFKQFKPCSGMVLNMEKATSNYWAHFSIQNKSQATLILELDQPILESVELWYQDSMSHWQTLRSGSQVPIYQKRIYHPVQLFELPAKVTQFYIRYQTNGLSVPVSIWEKAAFNHKTDRQKLIKGIYLGLMLFVILSNIFWYFSLGSIANLLYALLVFLYTLFTSLPQGTLLYWFPNADLYFLYTSVPRLSGPMALLYAVVFLKTRQSIPKLTFVALLFGSYVFLGGFWEPRVWGSKLVAINELEGLIIFVLVLLLSFYTGRKGNRFGYYFGGAYLMFFGFALLNINYLSTGKPKLILDLDYFSIGTLLEVFLLAYLLWKSLEWEKKAIEDAEKWAQLRLFEQTKENERIVREQNVFLEKNVRERTAQLNESLDNLRSAQMKLVENEKMASLGILTAGIAHEINNPINFIASSLNPLKRNLDSFSELLEKYDTLAQGHEDYSNIEAFKEEIDYEYTCEETTLLLASISEGAQRTSEIVKGLRNFSRLDEGERKKACLNEGLESTLMLLQSNIKNKDIQLVKSLGKLPETLCYAGQLNQVFMNILTNAIQAMPKKGILTLQSELDSLTSEIKIRISDTGNGMSEAVMQKIFDPFFTTKVVGEGTGLGLSISYGIIQKHQGTIQVQSEVGKGSTFLIVLPVQH